MSFVAICLSCYGERLNYMVRFILLSVGHYENKVTENSKVGNYRTQIRTKKG